MSFEYSSYLISCSSLSLSIDHVSKSALSRLLSGSFSHGKLLDTSYRSQSHRIFQSHSKSELRNTSLHKLKTCPSDKLKCNNETSCLTTKHRTMEQVQSSNNKGRKSVTFSDNHGLELSQIKLFSEMPDDPPISVLAGLQNLTLSQNSSSLLLKQIPLISNFTDSMRSYRELNKHLAERKVTLEKIKSDNGRISGTILVQNINFEKQVILRYTYDEWIVQKELVATFKESCYSGMHKNCDRFMFELDSPHQNVIPHGMEFAICFKCDGNTYWDNNNGTNYKMSFPVEQSRKHATLMEMHSTKTNWTTFSSWNILDNTAPYW